MVVLLKNQLVFTGVGAQVRSNSTLYCYIPLTCDCGKVMEPTMHLVYHDVRLLLRASKQDGGDVLRPFALSQLGSLTQNAIAPDKDVSRIYRTMEYKIVKSQLVMQRRS